MTDSTLTPHLVVSDGDAAIAFYEKAFGAVVKERDLAEDGKRIMHAYLDIGAGGIYLRDEFPEIEKHGTASTPDQLGGVSCVFHLDVPDANVAWERAVAAGAEVVMALEDRPWGMRYGQIRDPFGHVWSIGSPLPEA